MTTWLLFGLGMVTENSSYLDSGNFLWDVSMCCLQPRISSIELCNYFRLSSLLLMAVVHHSSPICSFLLNPVCVYARACVFWPFGLVTDGNRISRAVCLARHV